MMARSQARCSRSSNTDQILTGWKSTARSASRPGPASFPARENDRIAIARAKTGLGLSTPDSTRPAPRAGCPTPVLMGSLTVPPTASLVKTLSRIRPGYGTHKRIRSPSMGWRSLASPGEELLSSLPHLFSSVSPLRLSPLPASASSRPSGFPGSHTSHRRWRSAPKSWRTSCPPSPPSRPTPPQPCRS